MLCVVAVMYLTRGPQGSRSRATAVAWCRDAYRALKIIATVYELSPNAVIALLLYW